MRKLIKWCVIGFVGLVILGAIAGGGASTSSTTTTTQNDEADDSSGTTEEPKKEREKSKPEADAKPKCGSKATDDCTPRMSMDQSVRVDALNWNVTGVKTASSLGDMEYGLGEKADGTFVIVSLKVHSSKHESVTLSDEVVQLETSDGDTYKSDSDGTIAAMGEGQEPLFFEDIGPDATMSSKVVFDLPDSALNKKLSVRFGELGFGTTHGYIKLSSLGG
jgi:hypothetical protein